jgi:DNA-directed RNA polymerase subunit RPC12/RpoP
MGNKTYTWICPHCGNSNSMMLYSCDKCGKIVLHDDPLKQDEDAPNVNFNKMIRKFKDKKK